MPANNANVSADGSGTAEAGETEVDEILCYSRKVVLAMILVAVIGKRDQGMHRP